MAVSCSGLHTTQLMNLPKRERRQRLAGNANGKTEAIHYILEKADAKTYRKQERKIWGKVMEE